MNREFLQFYTRGTFPRNETEFYQFFNGFNYITNEASPRWVYYPVSLKENFNKDEVPMLQYPSDEIYVSVFFKHHFKFVFVWARSSPEIKFFI